MGDDHASGDLVTAGAAHRTGHRTRDRPRRLALALPRAGLRALDFRRRRRHLAEIRRSARPRTPDLDRPAFAAAATGPSTSPGRTRSTSAARESGAPRSFPEPPRRSPARRRSSTPPSPARFMSPPTAARPGATLPCPDFRDRPPPSPPAPDHPEIAYVSYSGLRAPVRSTWGVAKTTDAGRHWEPVYDNVRDAWLTDRFGAGWAGNPIGLGVAPHDANLVYATDSGRVLRTTDGGKTLEPDLLLSHAGRQLDHQRDRRHHLLRRPLRPLRSAPHVHQLHRYRPVGQRYGGRQLVQRHAHRRAAPMGEHHLLDGVRSRGARPHVGRR